MKKTCMLLFSLMCLGTIKAQSNYFNSINVSKPVQEEVHDSIEIPIEIKKPEPSRLKTLIQSLSLQDLEYLTKRFVSKHSFSSEKNKHDRDSNVLSLYNGENHELSVSNLMSIMEEVGISNRLFVLAQSLLETGYYKSNACINLHNLFGLTNPRTGRLYKFDCWESSVVAYKRYVQYKYKGGSYLSFLKKIGYAEDPRYISKVIHISRQLNKSMNLID